MKTSSGRLSRHGGGRGFVTTDPVILMLIRVNAFLRGKQIKLTTPNLMKP
jgi:hypothetical protein